MTKTLAMILAALALGMAALIVFAARPCRPDDAGWHIGGMLIGGCEAR